MKEFKNFFTKKKNIGFVALICVFAIGSLIATSKNEVPLHDGDILVDSQNVNTNDDKSAANQYDSDTLTEMRSSIELERNKLLDTYNEIINNSKNDKEVSAAKDERNALLEIIKLECEMENMIKTKSIPESLVLITESSVNVTVNSESLEQDTATKICDIVMRETNRPASEIIVNAAT